MDDVLLGGPNTATSTTAITNNMTSAIVLAGYSNSGIGVYGNSAYNIGMEAANTATDQPAFIGWSAANFTGVQGWSGPTVPPAAKAKTGVYGRATQDSAAKGVWGDTTTGHAVHGTATTGFAGYFGGKVYLSKFAEMTEITAPAAPGTDKARLFLRDNGSGKTQLCVRFNTGAIQVLATQP